MVHEGGHEQDAAPALGEEPARCSGVRHRSRVVAAALVPDDHDELRPGDAHVDRDPRARAAAVSVLYGVGHCLEHRHGDPVPPDLVEGAPVEQAGERGFDGDHAKTEITHLQPGPVAGDAPTHRGSPAPALHGPGL